MSNNKGITLLEIMITIIVVSLGILTLMDVLNTGLYINGMNKNRIIALNLSSEKMEEVKNASSYANIDNYASERLNLGGEFADFDRAVTVSGDPKEVNVTVYWNDKGEEVSVHLSSLFSNYGY